MKKTPLAIFVTIFVLLVGGCAHTPASKPPPPRKPFLDGLKKLFPKPKTPPPVATPVNWAGTIRLVNTADNFVLIEAESATALISSEYYLAVQNGSETGTLRMTSLKAPPFQIADITGGHPAVGDKIYIPRPNWSAPPTSQALPADGARSAEN
jgi:hypothetical protein